MADKYEDEYVFIEIAGLFDQHWWFHIQVFEDKVYKIIECGYEFDMSAKDIKNHPEVPYHGPAKHPVHWFKVKYMGFFFPDHISDWILKQLDTWVAEKDYDFNQSYIDSTCDDREGK